MKGNEVLPGDDTRQKDAPPQGVTAGMDLSPPPPTSYGFAVKSAKSKLEPWSYERGPLGVDEIEIRVRGGKGPILSDGDGHPMGGCHVTEVLNSVKCSMHAYLCPCLECMIGILPAAVWL